MNIRLDSTGHAALYASGDCPFCGRRMLESGACACGVWKRTPVNSPTFLIELTPNHRELVNKEGYWAEQFKAAKAEKGQAA